MISDSTELQAHELTLSAAANERYWAAAGLDHPALRAGRAYPLIAANCTVLAWLATCDTPVIQTRQRVWCRRQVATPVVLDTSGTVTARFVRRGREYVTVATDVRSDGSTIWSSEVDFTPAATLAPPTTRAGAPADEPRSSDRSTRPQRLDGERRAFTITDELIRRYSRRGNYHSEPSTAAELGLPGLVAQGTQVCGQAYDMLLASWGEAFLEAGTFESHFVAIVLGGETTETTVAINGGQAEFEVWNTTSNRPAATGTANIQVRR